MAIRKRRWFAAAIAAVLGVASVAVIRPLAVGAHDDPKPEQEGQQPPSGVPDLVKGLKETPGCLGVETARTQSGKNVIFAWFENKKAAMAWYRSPTHEFYMGMMGGGGRPPLAQVPDDGKPILCIASMTPSKEQKVEGAPIHISQLSIELYSVVPGGASIGGTFAPTSLAIPNHHKYDADDAPAAKPAEK